MSDFTTFVMNYNTGSDSAPTFTGNTLAFSGSSGANELRWVSSTSTPAASGSTASASWPYVNRPASVSAINQLWAFTADTTGSQVATYTGDNTKANVLRWSWDNVGTFASAPLFTAYGDNTHTSGPTTGAGAAIVNGSADTSNTSYLKANAYGYGVDTSGNQQTPSAGTIGSSYAATAGTAGAVSPASASWLTTWQSLQANTQYIQNGVVPKATTAGYWYFSLILYAGPNLSTGTLTPVITLSYSYA